jgi:hypothetical protein
MMGDTDMNTNTSELDTTELEAVSGGMKWSPVKNDDVIDARGGQITFWGFSVTFDVGGHISSFGRL